MKLETHLKYWVILLIFLTIISSVLEILALASLVPLLEFILEPTKNEYISFDGANNFMPDFEINDYIFFLCFLFVLKATIQTLLGFLNVRFSFTARFFFSKLLLTNYLFSNFSKIKNVNSSEILRNIIGEVATLANGVFMPILWIISEIIFLVLLISVVIYFNGYAILLAFLFLILLFIIIYFALKDKLSNWGSKRQYYDKHAIQYTQEAISSITDAKLNSLQKFFVERFSKPSYLSIKYNSFHLFIGIMPRIILETTVILFFLGTAYLIYTKTLNIDFKLLGLLFVSSFRVLPSINRLIVNFQQMNFYSASLNVVYKELLKIKLKNDNITSKKEIKKINLINLKNISFKYSKNSNYIFKKFNLIMKAGESIGIHGSSGTGKSTLINIVLGLYDLQNGKVLVNNFDLAGNESQFWQKVSYVPQKTFLIDDTLRSNIIISESEKAFKKDKFKQIIQISNSRSFIKRLKNGFETLIGEDVSFLSGGQRQRIGIARALYKDADVYIFDEITSSMDDKMAVKIINNIMREYSDKILIFVSHNQNIIKNCSKQILIDNIN